MFTFLATLVACGTFGLVEGYAGEGLGALLATDPDELVEFGETAPNAKSQKMDVQFVSAGDDALYVADAWIESAEEGVFTSGELPFPRTLQPGEAIPVHLRFKPNAQGAFTGTLLIEVGNEGEVVERTLSGEGCFDDDEDGTCD